MTAATLREAAQAVLDRWDSPQWEWTSHGPTADLMHALRAALAAPPAPGKFVCAGDDCGELRKDARRYRWLVRHASLGFDAAPSWNAVVRLPVLDSDDQTITALVDRAAAIDGATET